MRSKEVVKWSSLFLSGILLGASVLCPVKIVSLPVSTVICIVLGYMVYKSEIRALEVKE